jgi:signal transduction histidine kinase
VTPHAWETAWFRSAAVASLLLGIFLFARLLATRALRRKLRLLEAQQSLDRERSRISRDMHDEVGASLTQIAILSELLQRNIGQKEVAESYLKKISTTAQDVVESLDEIVWFINPKHDTLESLLFYIREHLTDFFESAGMECRFDIPDVIPALPLSADARRDIFMVVKEAATNVVKHSGATEVQVRGRIDEAAVEIRIEDNGRGMGQERRSAFGNGMENMQRRMKNIGGTFDIGASPGGGTVVTLRADARRGR